MISFFSGLFKLALFAIILVFAVYNFEMVTLRFANVYEFNLPLAVVLFFFFVLGLALGSTISWLGKVNIKKRQ